MRKSLKSINDKKDQKAKNYVPRKEKLSKDEMRSIRTKVMSKNPGAFSKIKLQLNSPMNKTIDH